MAGPGPWMRQSSGTVGKGKPRDRAIGRSMPPNEMHCSHFFAPSDFDATW